MIERFARVALPLPLATPYTYRIPPILADRVVPGARVVVPVRRQEWIGIVTEVDAASPAMAARDILAAPDADAALPAPLLMLGARMARYYGAPIGLVLRTMLPAALWGHSTIELQLAERGVSRVGGTAEMLIDWLRSRGGRATTSAAERALKRPVWDVVDRLQRIGALTIEVIAPDTGGGEASVELAVLVGESLPLLAREERFRRAPKQRALYQALEDRGGRASSSELLSASESGRGSLKALVDAGLVELVDVAVSRDPFDLPVAPAPALRLTSDQQDALVRLSEVPPGGSALLFGVTGSGKTQVYLERVRDALASGRGAILLVPEIALTPQTVNRVRAIFPDDVAVLHSGLSDGERADAWRALRRGERRIAIGPRSAIFAPVQRLGVIVLDEEHEATYKNGETPRYHARDVAAMRAGIEDAVVILGSATPSAESWARAVAADRVIRIPARVEARPMPPVELIDLKRAPQVAGAGVPWSEQLDLAVGATLGAGHQVLLLLNRRGWASYLQCSACGTVVECPNCSISLTVHRHPDRLRCHYCDYHSDVPSSCAVCGGSTARQVGAGTQQLERLVAERFPEARIARMDVDTTTSKWAHHDIFGRVERGEVDILLGTQMIAKGIDFPRVTLVGVVDADTSLHLPDFRSAERTFQLVAQVAGRTGRGALGGRVLVQTRQPEHPALQRAAAHDAEEFLRIEAAARVSPAYPPHTSLVHLVVSGEDRALVERRAVALTEWCERIMARYELPVIVVGPAPAPVERIKERWRMHLILKGPPQALGRWIRAAAPRLGATADGIRISIDRDPASLM